MAEKIMTVFGDEFFPKSGLGTSPSKRKHASDNLVGFLKGLQPDLVYLIPTAGTCVYLAFLCKHLKIPYILISPYPGFFDLLNKPDKKIMKLALDSAKSIIILHEEAPEDPEKREAVWDEAVEFATSVSTVIAFLYSKNTSVEYQTFMSNYSDKHYTQKLLLELAYDSRKVSFK